MHLVDLSVNFLGATPIVASTIPIAVGVALGCQMRQEKRVTVVFFGDAGVEEGVFHESLNFAVLKNLAVVFVCENNFYSVNTPLSLRQPQGREIFRLARGYGLDSFQGDGNDVIEVFNLAGKAVQKARQGKGPTFLEFKTYRWREHCGPLYDYPSGCRSEDELKEWQKRCPVERLKEYMFKEGLITGQDIENMASKLNKESEEAVLFAKQSPFPAEDFLLKDIFA
jgi:pyruvate dehydrogenase E1 component alpha subunit